MVILLVILGCKENVDISNRYVFTSPTAMSYMEKFPEKYGAYTELLYRTPVSHISNTTVGQLLTARGYYTVFAPTNDAIQLYLDTLYSKGVLDRKSVV